MSWAALLEIIKDECGNDLALRIEQRARSELGGVRLTVSVRPVITREIVSEAAPGDPQKAARKLGIHRATAYRALKRTNLMVR